MQSELRLKDDHICDSDHSIENENPDSMFSDEKESGYLVLTFNNSGSSQNAKKLEEPSPSKLAAVSSTRLTTACLSNVRTDAPKATFPARRKTIRIISCSGSQNRAQIELLNGQKVVRIIKRPVALQPKNIIEDIEPPVENARQPLFITAPSATETPPESVSPNDDATVDSGLEVEECESYNSVSSGPLAFSDSSHNFTKTARMLKCNLCQKYYRNQYSLRHHICLKRKDVWRKGDVPTKLVEGKVVYYCPTCMKPFRWLGNLTRHFYVHTGQRFFKCEMCNKEFFSAYQVRRHMNSHTGLRFKCEICAKPFTCKYACAWHTRQHYNPEKAAQLVPKR